MTSPRRATVVSICFERPCERAYRSISRFSFWKSFSCRAWAAVCCCLSIAFTTGLIAGMGGCGSLRMFDRSAELEPFSSICFPPGRMRPEKAS